MDPVRENELQFGPPPPDGEPLGCILRPGGALFRLFAPRATSVTLELFERFEDERGEAMAMHRGNGGTWEIEVRRETAGRWYGYRIDGPGRSGEMFDPSVLVADPWGQAVTTVNHWRIAAETLIVPAGAGGPPGPRGWPPPEEGARGRPPPASPPARSRPRRESAEARASEARASRRARPRRGGEAER